MNKYSREEVYNNTLDYFKGDSLATNVWIDKYCLKDDNDAYLELSPDDMHHRLADEFFRIESKYPNPLSYTEIYHNFKNFRNIIPQGRVMAGLGVTNSFRSLSNCLVLPGPKDSYSSIMYTDTMLVSSAKRGCGYGMDLSKLRPVGDITKNASKTSTGVVPFMERYSNSTREVGQQNRRGACLLGLDISHPQSYDFATAKTDKTKVTGANISLKIPDRFFRAIEDNKFFNLEFNNTIYKSVNAREYWNSIISTVKKDSEPGIFIWDRINNYDPVSVYINHRISLTNACQPADATVLTPGGIVKLENVSVGDIIWSGSKWTTIINKWCTGVKKVYKYKTTSGYFLGTDNHKVIEEGKKVEVKNAKKLDYVVGDPALLSKAIDNRIVMDGLVLGDGSVHKASNGLIYLYIGKKDTDYFNSEVKSLIVKYRPGIKKETAYEIITSILKDELPKTYNRIIPDRFFYGDEITKRSFLRGLFSANGTVSGGRVCLKQTSLKLIEQVREMLSSLGIHSYITTNKAKVIKFYNGEYLCKQSYDINITHGKYLFRDYIGFIQQYKQSTIGVSRGIKFKSSDIKETEYIGKQLVYSITVDNEEHTYWTGGVLVSNCGEQPMSPYDSCRLIVLNLYSIVDKPFTKEARIDYNKLKELVKVISRLADDLVDLEIEYVDRIINKISEDPEPENEKAIELVLWNNIKNKAIAGRRTGMGITGLGDMLAALGVIYGSEESLIIVNKVFNTKLRFELEEQITLAKERGKFPDCNPELEDPNSNDFYKMISIEYLDLWNLLQAYGRRSINWNTIAPTGSTSVLTQTTSGCEPVFKINYNRRRKVNELHPNKTFRDKVGDWWEEYTIYHHKFIEWAKINQIEAVDSHIKDSPYYLACAHEINPINRVKLQSILQKYTTSAISSTINLPKEVSVETISNLYLQAWKLGCKGLTVYVEGSRDGVLITNDVSSIPTFGYHSAPKRPKELKAKIFRTKVVGVPYGIVVGLLENKPYEIFCIPNWEHGDISGIIVKPRKQKFDFIGDIIIEDINTLGSQLQKTLNILLSGILRHGANPTYLVKWIDKCESGITAYENAVKRIIKKFSVECSPLKCPNCGENSLIMKEGCTSCNNCGYSHCG